MAQVQNATELQDRVRVLPTDRVVPTLDPNFIHRTTVGFTALDPLGMARDTIRYRIEDTYPDAELDIDLLDETESYSRLIVAFEKANNGARFR